MLPQRLWIAGTLVGAYDCLGAHLTDLTGCLAAALEKRSGMSWLAPGLVCFVWLATAQPPYKPAAIAQANLGVTLAKDAKYREAVQAYKRAIAIDPTLPNIQLNLGLAWFKLGNFQEALGAFEKETPSDRVTTLIGMSYFGLAKYKDAAARLKPLAVAQPGNSELAYLLAKCYMWSGDPDAALAIFRRLLERDPDSAVTHMLMGEALDAEYRTDEAVREFETAVKNGTSQPDVHFGLGYLYWKEKRYDDAAREFKFELANNPKHPKALEYLGDVELKTAQNAEAIATLKKAVEAQKDLHLAHLDLAILYQQNKHNEQAVVEYREAIRTDAASFDAHYRLGRLLREMGRKTEADREFTIVQKLHEKKTEEPLLRISGPRP